MFIASSAARVWAADLPTVSAKPKPAPMVTFIELGSVNCVPCRAMQPVMEEVRKKYGEQVNVVFHDVWTSAGELYGRNFKIKVIPTQVFLDAKGKEYFRHEGFFPAEELYKVLKIGGVKL
ncbi:MAG: thioredoxin family protein [Rectinemataceae bacterium]|nr:thioredoxin family protein [Rectinemataceae bacterium]